MSKAGRPHKSPPRPYSCPVCGKQLYRRETKVLTYRCNCGRSYDLIEGELRPKERRARVETVREERPALEWWEFEQLSGWEPAKELLKELVRE